MVKDIHIPALNAAGAALDRRLIAEAVGQGSYVHKFPDGKLSMELEWIDATCLARSAIVAYLAHIDAADAGK